MRRTLETAIFIVVLGACVPPPRPTPPVTPPAPPPAVSLVPPDAWPELADDLSADTLARAAEKSQAYLAAQGDKLVEIGPLSVGTRLLSETLSELVRIRRESPDGAALTQRLKEGFELYRVRGSTPGGGAFYSSYYQPVLEASRTRTAEFKYPLYRKPADLIEVDLAAFDPKYKDARIYGRVTPEGSFVPYFTRSDIDLRDQLAGKNLEVAWLKDSFERLDIHIEGSGLLRFTDGTMAMARFAATNGRPYQSVGLAVIGSGAMTRAELTHETLKAYLAAHPEGEGWLLARNPRYTFFEVVDLPADGEPNGTIGQALTAGRSIAVDASVVPLGAAAWVSVPLPQADAEGRLLARGPVKRFMLAQDTGGAIKGPGRVDLYMGHGSDAQTVARRVWDAGELYVLVLKRPARTR